MSRLVTIAPGYRNVVLPNGEMYQAGQSVTISDEEFARIRPSLVGTVVVDGGDVADPTYVLRVMPENTGVVFRANTPNGGVTRSVEHRMTTEYDRPWDTWADENGRTRVAVGYHTRDFASQNLHAKYEVKTSDDPAGPTPARLLTRFTIGTDAEVTTAGFTGVSEVEINRGVHSAGARFGLAFRTPNAAGTDTVKVGEFMTQIDASSNTLMDFDPTSSTGSAGASIRFYRNVNTTGTRQLRILKGNGTNTDVWTFDAGQGRIAISNATGVPGSNYAGGGYLYAEGGALKWRGSAGTVTTLAAA